MSDSIHQLSFDQQYKCYHLTHQDTRISRYKFANLYHNITNQDPTLFQRLTKYDVNCHSGPALFSALLPNDFYYEKQSIIIYEGILVSGQINRTHFLPHSLLHQLKYEYGHEYYDQFITDLIKMLDTWAAPYPNIEINLPPNNSCMGAGA